MRETCRPFLIGLGGGNVERVDPEVRQGGQVLKYHLASFKSPKSYWGRDSVPNSGGGRKIFCISEAPQVISNVQQV